MSKKSACVAAVGTTYFSHDKLTLRIYSSTTVSTQRSYVRHAYHRPQRVCQKEPLQFLPAYNLLTEHWAPGLVDDIKADGAGHLINVGVEHAVLESDRGRLERVFLGQRNVYLPDPPLVRGWYYFLQQFT